MTDSMIRRQVDPPQVSIIVNCFNGEKYLQESLESALSQSYLDWELIFWDNRSQDRSAEVLLGYKDLRFKYYLSPEFTSLGRARNLAVSKANGKWLAFMDCDDVWPANKLALQMAAIEDAADFNVGLVYGLFEMKVEGTAAAGQYSTAGYYSGLVITPHGPIDLFPKLAIENFIIFSSVLIDPTLRQNEDYDLLLKASQYALAICVNATCVIYRVHAGSNSHSQVTLSYDEFDRIYNALPDSPTKFAAIRRNKSRFAAHKIRCGEIFIGIAMLIKEGSVIWFVRRLLVRLGRPKSNAKLCGK
jgi:glycosyltransferase involved in cell wall biosynthesis